MHRARWILIWVVAAMQLPLYEVCRDLYSQKYCDPFDRVIMPHEVSLPCLRLLPPCVTAVRPSLHPVVACWRIDSLV